MLRELRKTLQTLIRAGQVLYIRIADITHMKGKSRGRRKNRTNQPGKTCHVPIAEGIRANNNIPRDQPRVSSNTNDNQCVIQLKPLLLTGTSTEKTMNTLLNAKLNVGNSVHTMPGHSQKNEINPGAAGCYSKRNKLKSVKSVSCVIPLSYVNSVINALNVVTNLPDCKTSGESG